MDIPTLHALGLPPSLFAVLQQIRDADKLGELSLSKFIALWRFRDAMKQRPNGDLYAHFGDFIQLQAVATEIGAAIGSVSTAESHELVQLGNPEDDVDPNTRWTILTRTATYLIDSYQSLFLEPPMSLHEVIWQLSGESPLFYFPEMAEIEDPDELAAVEVSFDKLWQPWENSADLFIDTGINIARAHTDFFYNMGEFATGERTYGAQSQKTRQPEWPIKREYLLTQCRIWANLCRPDLAHLLDGA